MSAIVDEFLRSGICTTLDGQHRRLTGGVTLREANAMQRIIRDHSLRRTIETGVACGVSTLAICEALMDLPPSAPVVHYGIDPMQHSEHGGAALQILQRHRVDSIFKLLEGPTHLEAPKLLVAGAQVDFAFVDGYHTFDYSLIDFFFLDKMLRPGGFMAIHDAPFASKKKLLGYIFTHRHYEIFDVPELGEPLSARLRWRLKGIKHGDPCWYRLYSGGANMIVLRKNDVFEPDWNFFADF